MTKKMIMLRGKKKREMIILKSEPKPDDRRRQK